MHYFKKISTIFLSLSFLVSAAQNEKVITNIKIRYQSSFAVLPEFYEIKIDDRTVDYISPIITIPSGERTRESKRFNRKKWNEIMGLINRTNFLLMDSTSAQQIFQSRDKEL